MKRTGIANDIGLLTKATEKSSSMLYYIPLLLLPFLNLLYGINTSFKVGEIILILAMYIGVGFMFMIVVLASNNLTICIIAHILYNFLATISLVGNTHIEIIIVNAIITVIYFVYLLFRTKTTKEYFSNINI